MAERSFAREVETLRMGEGGEFHGVAIALRFQNHGVNVSFHVVDADEGFGQRETQPLGIRQPDQERPHQAGPDGRGNGIERIPIRRGLRHGRLNHGYDGAQMLPGRQFRNYAAVLTVRGEL